jgi:hypothetical protein
MDRRALIAGSAALVSVARTAVASEKKAPAEGASLNMPGMGLPVIVDGRLRNYVFVTLKLHLGGGATAEGLTAKTPFLRDALVKAAHRTPFVIAGDWTQLNGSAIAATVMRTATTIVGAGKITRVEILSQAPRRRTGMPAG